MAQSRDFDPVKYIQNDHDRYEYLTACLHEDHGDGQLVGAAVRDVMRSLLQKPRYRF